MPRPPLRNARLLLDQAVGGDVEKVVVRQGSDMRAAQSAVALHSRRAASTKRLRNRLSKACYRVRQVSYRFEVEASLPW